jgi:hypothetical protein
MLRSIPLLDITPEVAALTSGILASGKIPRKAAIDAAHIANAVIVKALPSVCRKHGWESR